MSRNCCVALPRDARGLSVICDCGIFRSYSLFLTPLYLLCGCEQRRLWRGCANAQTRLSLAQLLADAISTKKFVDWLTCIVDYSSIILSFKSNKYSNLQETTDIYFSFFPNALH